jgi:hypothetical protein
VAAKTYQKSFAENLIQKINRLWSRQLDMHNTRKLARMTCLSALTKIEWQTRTQPQKQG